MFYGLHITENLGGIKYFIVNDETQEEYEVEFENGDYDLKWPNGAVTTNRITLRVSYEMIHVTSYSYQIANQIPLVHIEINGAKLKIPLQRLQCKIWVED
jgi:hypothetical protein